MTRPLCTHASALLPGQPKGGRLRTCALGLGTGGKCRRLVECATCESHSAAKSARVALPVVAACVHLGEIVERCPSCKSEVKHVRECDVHERCTLEPVKRAGVQKVTDCQTCRRDGLGYEPAKEQT